MLEFYAVYQWLRTKDGEQHVYIDDVACKTYPEMLREAFRALDDGDLIEVHHRKPDGTVEVISPADIEETQYWCRKYPEHSQQPAGA